MGQVFGKAFKGALIFGLLGVAAACGVGIIPLIAHAGFASLTWAAASAVVTPLLLTYTAVGAGIGAVGGAISGAVSGKKPEANSYSDISYQSPAPLEAPTVTPELAKSQSQALQETYSRGFQDAVERSRAAAQNPQQVGH